MILRHDHPVLHWDFLLEHQLSAATWRLSTVPELGQSVSAERIPDHRLVYLTYEGPVSGDRGSVSRVIWGSYTVVQTSGIQSTGAEPTLLTIDLSVQPTLVFPSYAGRIRAELRSPATGTAWFFEQLGHATAGTPG